MRAARFFYDTKLKQKVNYNSRKNKGKHRFLTFTDYFVREHFDKDMLKLFGITKLDSLSNKLAAVIMPSCLKREIESIQKDIKIFRNEKE